MKKTTLQKSIPYIHPLLMFLYPIAQFYAHNITELTPDLLLRPVIACFAATLAAWALLSILPRIRPKAPLLLTLSWFFFFSYGHIVNSLFPEKVPLGMEIGYGALFVFLFTLLIALPSNLKALHSPLAVILLVLFLIPAGKILLYYMQGNAASGLLLSETTAFPPELKASLDRPTEKLDRPDIYYLVFDRYASSRSLRQFLQFDNSAFEEKLREKGFTIADRSMTNFPYTFLSLASSLNARFFDELENRGKTRDKTYIYNLIKEAVVPRYLKEQGYRYIHIGSWWEPTRSNRHADKIFYYDPITTVMARWKLSEFEYKLLKTSWVDLAVRRMEAQLSQARTEDALDIDAQKALNQIQALLDSASERGPKFVFCHFLITHPPYFFKADGSLNLGRTRDITNDPRIYLDSIRFANRQILKMVETIDRVSDHKPVIIIQADEGPYTIVKKPNDAWKNFYSRIRFRTQIMNALRIPGIDEKLIYPTISPVNTFRLLFNHLFQTRLPMLKDRTLLIMSPRDLYTFRDDTNRLRQNEEYFETHPMED